MLTAAVVAPVIVYDVFLQAARIVDRYNEIVLRPDRMTSLDWLGLLASTLLFHAGFALLSAALLLPAERAQRAATALVQLLALSVVTVETASFIYFLHTGSSLDYAQATYSLGQPAHFFVVLDLVEPVQWGGLCLVAAVIALAPLAVRGARQWSGTSSRPALFPLGLAGLGAAVAALGLLPLSEQAIDRAVVRDPVLNLVATARSDRPARGSRVAPPDLAIAKAAPDAAPRNVVVVLLESSRAVSFQPWVPGRTTPFFEQLSRRSLLATRAYAVMPGTSKALIATLCGAEPSHTIRSLSLELGLLSRCLPALLAEQGYRTVFFQSADPRFAARVETVRDMGVAEFHAIDTFPLQGFERANFLGYEDEVMLAPSERWLGAHRDKPFLATYLTVAPHHDCFPLSRHGIVALDRDPEVNRYENNLRSEDFFLRALYQQYANLGLLESTIFVVLGDHGEGFGEHGRRAHNDNPYEEGLHIPLLLHDPSGKLIPPGRLDAPVNQLDVLPTILELLGYRVARGKLPGASLLHPLPARSIMSACIDEQTCLAHLRGHDKLVHHYGRQPDELFDLAVDPREQLDLAARKPELAAAMLRDLLHWDLRVRARFWGDAPAPDKSR